MLRACAVLVVVLAMASCAKEAKPPRAPQKCGKVERGTDRVLDVVLCAGADGDGDGVDDAVDLCPEHKELLNYLADKDGCPDPDRDVDVFVDYEDACPDEPGVAPDGCPPKDTDGDTIADHLDGCPHEREDLDGDRDDDGCPDGVEDKLVATALKEQLWQKARIDVEKGKAKASKRGAAELATLTDTVTPRAGDVARVRLVGYVSLREVRKGKAKQLAKERVKLVEEQLAAAGVKPAAFERAIYPLKDKKEKVGRVDVMVFLDLARAIEGEQKAADPEGEGAKPAETEPAETKPAETKPAETKTAETKPAETKPAETKPAETKPAETKPGDDRDAVEPYPEPEKPASDDDWDIVGNN